MNTSLIIGLNVGLWGFWGCTICLCLMRIFECGVFAEASNLRKKAIKYGYAKWNIKNNGKTEFEWIVPKEYKEDKEKDNYESD